MTSTSHLLTRLHDDGDARDQVGRLLAHLRALVVQPPEDRAADLRQVGLDALAERVHHGAEAAQHDDVLGQAARGWRRAEVSKDTAGSPGITSSQRPARQRERWYDKEPATLTATTISPPLTHLGHLPLGGEQSPHHPTPFPHPLSPIPSPSLPLVVWSGKAYNMPHLIPSPPSPLPAPSLLEDVQHAPPIPSLRRLCPGCPPPPPSHPPPLPPRPLTSVVCSWKAYRMPSISCSSRRESTSDAPRFPIAFSIVSITILRYCSDSSFRSSTTRLMISEAPTLLAISTVVSTSWTEQEGEGHRGDGVTGEGGWAVGWMNRACNNPGHVQLVGDLHGRVD